MTEQYQPIADLIGRVRARWRRLVALRAVTRSALVATVALGVVLVLALGRRTLAGRTGRAGRARSPAGRGGGLLGIPAASAASVRSAHCALHRRTPRRTRRTPGERRRRGERRSGDGAGVRRVDDRRCGACCIRHRALGDRSVRVVAPDRIPGGCGRARVPGRRVFRPAHAEGIVRRGVAHAVPLEGRPRRHAGRCARRGRLDVERAGASGRQPGAGRRAAAAQRRRR